MKNSFFLIIPAQRNNAERLGFYQPDPLKKWLMDLPTANPGLATRLFHEFICEFNSVEMDSQFRLDTLELIRPAYIRIEEYLKNNILRTGLPKSENEEKIYQFLVSLQREFTIGYWIVAKDISKKQTGWFQNKNVALAIQRVMHGLGSIVLSQKLVYLPVMEWVWMDLHSLYKLAVKLKKETYKIQDIDNATCTIQESYKKIILLSIVDASGLNCKEILQYVKLSERWLSLLKLTDAAEPGQQQFMILQDEDSPPVFEKPDKSKHGNAVIYINMDRLLSAVAANSKYVDKNLERFYNPASEEDGAEKEKLSLGLANYIHHKWAGNSVPPAQFFVDKSPRLISIGINATFNYLSLREPTSDLEKEFLGTPVSDWFINCRVDHPGLISIGSLVSFRKEGKPENKRSLGVVIYMVKVKNSPAFHIALKAIAPQVYFATYFKLDSIENSMPQKALIYGKRDNGVEKSFLISDSHALKNFDVLRMDMRGERFPVILRDKTSIGLGYWQFECRRVEEKDLPEKYR